MRAGLPNEFKEGIAVFRFLNNRKNRPRDATAVIIGTHYAAFQLYQQLKVQGRYQIFFLIGEDPWEHGHGIEGAEVRYPSELASLCARYQVSAIFYTDDSQLEGLPTVDIPMVKG